jgi:hypothetical protein
MWAAGLKGAEFMKIGFDHIPMVRGVHALPQRESPECHDPPPGAPKGHLCGIAAPADQRDAVEG